MRRERTSFDLGRACAQPSHDSAPPIFRRMNQKTAKSAPTSVGRLGDGRDGSQLTAESLKA